MDLNEYYQKMFVKDNNFRVRIDKIIGNGLSTCPREKTQRSTKINSRVTNSTKVSKCSLSKQNKNQEEFRLTRRQNQLNTLFRIRKQKLQMINQKNREIYRRLNSQQSYYAHTLDLKQKNENEEPLFSFRTLDSVQNRQILGPIHNFKPASSFSTIEKQSRSNYEDEKIVNSRCSFSIRKKTRFQTINNDQNRYQTPIKLKEKISQKQTTPLQQNKSLQKLKAFRTPTRIIRLPQIYSLL